MRKYSQYNEQSYSDFPDREYVTQFGAVRPLLPADGKTLVIAFEMPSTSPAAEALSFDGTTLFRGWPRRLCGAIGPWRRRRDLRRCPDRGLCRRIGPRRGSGCNRSAAADRQRLPTGIFNGAVTLFGQQRPSLVRDGVTLSAAELVLVGGNIDDRQQRHAQHDRAGPAPFDSTSLGMNYTTSPGTTVLALSNGNLDFLGSNGGSRRNQHRRRFAALFRRDTGLRHQRRLGIDPLSAFRVAQHHARGRQHQYR